MAVSRAIVYHPVRFDVKNLLATLWGFTFRSSLESGLNVEEFELSFAKYVGTRHRVQKINLERRGARERRPNNGNCLINQESMQ